MSVKLIADNIELTLQRVTKQAILNLLLVGFLTVGLIDIFRDYQGMVGPRSALHALSLLLTWKLCTLFTRYGAAILTGLFIAVASIHMTYQTVLSGGGICQDCGAAGWLFVSAISIACLASLLRMTLNEKESLLFSLAGLTCVAVPVVQLILLALIPKMCPSCIAAGCAATSALRFSIPESDGSRLGIFPFKLVLAPLVIISLLTLAGSGIGRPTVEPVVSSKPIAGENVSRLGLIGSIHPDGLILLYLPGCHWCEQTRVFLKANSIQFSEIDLTTIAPNSILDRSFAPQLVKIRGGLASLHIRGYNESAMMNLMKGKL